MNEANTRKSLPPSKDEKSPSAPPHSPMVQEFIDSLIKSNREEAEKIAAWKNEPE